MSALVALVAITVLQVGWILFVVNRLHSSYWTVAGMKWVLENRRRGSGRLELARPTIVTRRVVRSWQ